MDHMLHDSGMDEDQEVYTEIRRANKRLASKMKKAFRPPKDSKVCPRHHGKDYKKPLIKRR